MILGKRDLVSSHLRRKASGIEILSLPSEVEVQQPWQ